MTTAENTNKKNRLGRGLASLIGEDEFTSPEISPEIRRDMRSVPIELVAPNPNNPRKVFLDSDIESLAQSIRQKGLVQPVILRKSSHMHGRYEIIAGERRWRAAQAAGLHEIQAVIRDISEQEAQELALIENIQRTDLNPLEEAGGYEYLINKYQYTQIDLAKNLGKSRAHIANMLRLLKLPNSVKDYLTEGLLSIGHARALISADQAANLADIVVARGLNVRETERLANRQGKLDQHKTSQLPQHKDPNITALEKKLADHLGVKVVINCRPMPEKQKNNDATSQSPLDQKQKGQMEISFQSFRQLDEICSNLLP